MIAPGFLEGILDPYVSFTRDPFEVRDSETTYTGHLASYSQINFTTGGGNTYLEKNSVQDLSSPLQWAKNSPNMPADSVSMRAVLDSGPSTLIRNGTPAVVGTWYTLNTSMYWGCEYPGVGLEAHNTCVLEFALTSDTTTVLARMTSITHYIEA